VSLQYAGELIAAFIERAGGSVGGEISTGTMPEGLEPIYVHRPSRTLSEILAELLRSSNNYIANQVFLEIGLRRPGGKSARCPLFPQTRRPSVRVARPLCATSGPRLVRSLLVSCWPPSS
jgi:D-alanyl-D-alanine carboxypeptidase/D-alanyl-D-alanine-endopeptidase (penicillin-binding protein 4)